MPPPLHLVLANASAGSTAADAVGQAVTRLAEDVPTRLRWTTSVDDFHAAVRDAGDARLVVAGGDGSISLALSTVTDLDRTDEPVGIIPLGTGNDFARNHDVPLDPIAAAEVVLTGTPTGIAAIEAIADDCHTSLAGDLVANNLHIGLGVDVARTAHAWKPRLGRLAYPVATVYRGVRASSTVLAIDADGDRVRSGPLLAALVLLGPSMGGGVEVADTDPDAIDLVVVEPTSLWARPGLVRASMGQRLPEHPRAHRWKAESLRVTGVSPIRANVDGELKTFGTSLTLRRRPAAWQVIV